MDSDIFEKDEHHVIFDGLRFHKSSSTGYWYPTKRGDNEALHRKVYKKFIGPIKRGTTYTTKIIIKTTITQII